MCRTMIFKTPAIMKREALRFQIEDVKEQLYMVSCMNVLPADVQAKILEEYRKELHDLELQLKETEFNIY